MSQPLRPAEIPTELIPLVNIIENTPRENAIQAVCEQIHKGLSHRQLLSALLLSTVRKSNSHHEVYGIHSAHQLSLDVSYQDRALPLLWALDSFKWLQEKDPAPLREELTESIPGHSATEVFQQSMEQWDFETAEPAIVGILRNRGIADAIELMWQYAVRDWGFIGHKAIAVTNCWRVLQSTGYVGAEPIFRFMVSTLGDRLSGNETSQVYTDNLARITEGYAQLPSDWPDQKTQPAQVHSLVNGIRNNNANEASQFAWNLLLNGSCSAGTIWDAVHLSAAEFMLRHKQGGYSKTGGLNNRALHSNTVANALRYAYFTTQTPKTKLLILLQAVGWTAEFIQVETQRENVRDHSIFDLSNTELPAKKIAGSEILDLLPSRTHLQEIPDRTNQDRAAQMTFHFARQNQNINTFWHQARALLIRKANTDHHDCKFPVAMLETMNWMDKSWHPFLAAATVTWLHGPASQDSNVYRTVSDVRSAL